MTLHTTPADLEDLVLTAVLRGAWSSADVVATVTAEASTGRSDVIAMLWDLVDDGILRYDGRPAFPGFRAV